MPGSKGLLPKILVYRGVTVPRAGAILGRTRLRADEETQLAPLLPTGGVGSISLRCLHYLAEPTGFSAANRPLCSLRTDLEYRN